VLSYGDREATKMNGMQCDVQRAAAWPSAGGSVESMKVHEVECSILDRPKKLFFSLC